MERLEQEGELSPDEALNDRYHLRLYVAGNTVVSSRALINLRHFCDTHLNGRYDLEVLDLSQDPSAAAREGILALPTLVRLSPGPVKRFIGDMSNTQRLMKGLGLLQLNGDRKN
jgi:circadian clock protein KaiB